MKNLAAPLLLVAALCAVAPVPAAQDSADGPLAAEYALLQEWETGESGSAAQVAGVSWRHDTATWTLESGTVRFMRPLPDGAVTGFVFEGTGRFRMEVPDPFEVEQLRRFSGEPEITGIDEPFSRLVLRTSATLPVGLEATTDSARFARDAVARKRHEMWIRNAHLDVDALILAARLNAGDNFLCVDMDTESFGWLMYVFDPWRQEEVHLTKLQRLNAYAEDWVSLDRPQQRDDAGRPTSGPNEAIDIKHVDLDIDLSEHRGSAVKRNRPVEKDWAHFKAAVTFTSLADGLRAINIVLSAWADLRSVTSADGTRLEFLRDHVGARFATVDKDLYNWNTVVILDQALEAGASTTLVFEYDIEIYNYVSGRSWYPDQPGRSSTDLHTAELTFRLPKKVEVRSVGEEVESIAGANGVTSVWRVTEPTKTVAFSFGRSFNEERVQVVGGPEVIAFGRQGGVLSGNMVRNVAADVANSLTFYQGYFNVTIPGDRIYATSITAAHGQAFEGYLHLSLQTFTSESPGASELFRAHEAAHQLWGHMVRWGSYRDQWLSEAFAEYSAMLFIEATMADTTFFEQILDVYRAEQLGSLKSAMSKFARPWDVVAVREEREALGPIAAGYRASTARLPAGYIIQAYRKGPLVLHMIRSRLQTMSEEEDLFRAVMQEFLHTFAGKVATTADFKTLLERRTGRDWTAFFDAWVSGTAIPTYEWEWTVATNADGGTELNIHVNQSGVPDGFSATVPVQLHYGKGNVDQVFVEVDQPDKTFTIPVAKKPSKVLFNPNHAVLARVKG